MCLCRWTEMIHIHCLAQFPAPVNLNFYEYSWSKPGEMMVCSNKMPPAYATTAVALKCRWADMSQPSPFQLHFPLFSPTSCVWLFLSLTILFYFGLLHSLFLCLEVVSSRYSHGWPLLSVNALLRCSSTGRPSLAIPSKKASCRFQSLFERKCFRVC